MDNAGCAVAAYGMQPVRHKQPGKEDKPAFNRTRIEGNAAMSAATSQQFFQWYASLPAQEQAALQQQLRQWLSPKGAGGPQFSGRYVAPATAATGDNRQLIH